MSDDRLEQMLDALRREYARTEPTDGTGNTTTPDAETERVVHWMRDAWAAERASVEEDLVGKSVPLPLARAHAQRSRHAASRRFRRVATGLLVAAAVVLIVLRTRPNDVDAPLPVDVARATDSEHQDAAALNDATPEPSPAQFAGDAFRSRDDGIELVHGSVRLVLLAQTSPAPSTHTPD